MNEPRVTIVVVTYNSRHVLAAGLRSAKEAHDSGLVAECIVVDNDSTDGTADHVREHHGWCSFVPAGGNLGFGRASNLGFRRARTPYVLLLNPDAMLPKAGLERLLAFMEERPRVGATGPAIRQPDGRLQFAGALLTPRALLLHAIGHPRPWPEHRVIQPGEPPFRTSWLCGAILLMRRAMLEEVGGFDERYFLYFEETDLWQRARRAGWELWAVGEASATHVQAASARTTGQRLYHGCIAEHYFESRFRYLTAHFGWPSAAVAELGELGIMAARAAKRAFRGSDVDEIRARLRGPVLGLPRVGLSR
jgi:N-acetylglucosaminyl-diphospho-decaprenol L-rhamnosyltransferase